MGVNAGFILSTRSRPDGGWWGSGSRGFLEQLGLTSQGGLETFTYMEQKGPAPCPAQASRNLLSVCTDFPMQELHRDRIIYVVLSHQLLSHSVIFMSLPCCDTYQHSVPFYGQ